MRLLFLFSVLTCCLAAQSYRVDADTVLGLSWDSGIADFRDNLGDPVGAFVLQDGGRVLFWGSGTAVQFRNDHVVSLMLSSHSHINHPLSELVPRGLAPRQVRLPHGLSLDMEFTEIDRLLAGKLGTPDHRVQVVHQGLRYAMMFASMYSQDGSSESTYSLYQLTIEPTAGGDTGGPGIEDLGLF